MYPNPVVNQLTINLSEIRSDDKTGNVQIYNSLGQKLNVTSINDSKNMIDFSIYSKGIYYIEVVLGDKKWVQELIKSN